MDTNPIELYVVPCREWSLSKARALIKKFDNFGKFIIYLQRSLAVYAADPVSTAKETECQANPPHHSLTRASSSLSFIQR